MAKFDIIIGAGLGGHVCVDDETRGVEVLFKQNEEAWLTGCASILAPGEAKIGHETNKAKAFVAASVSGATSPRSAATDEKTVVTCTGAPMQAEIPKSLVAIGGVIGLEMGSVHARLGSRIIVGHGPKSCLRQAAR